MSAQGGDIFWAGPNGGTWNTVTNTGNWVDQNGSSSNYKGTAFTSGDNVFFGDKNPNGNVALPSTLDISVAATLPAAGTINFSNSTVSYTLSGQAISGTGFSKSGSGSTTIGDAMTINGASSITGGSLAVSGSLKTQTLTVSNASVTTTGIGTINASGGIQVNNGGSLILSGSGDNVGDSSSGVSTNITLAGGTLQYTQSSLESMGALTLQTVTGSSPTVSVLNLSGSNSQLAFTSASIPANTILQVWNWNAGDSLNFGSSTSSPSFPLNQIEFYSGNGTGSTFLGTASSGLVPVPEPSTIFGAIALVGAIGWRERRRFTGLAKLSVA